MKLSLLNILSELNATEHSFGRFNKRVFNSDLTTQLSYFVNGQHNLKDVGYFNIPADIIAKTIKNLNFITDNVDNVIYDATFGIFLYKFSRHEIWNNTEFYDTDDLKEIKSIMTYHKGHLIINDDVTSSDGVSFVALIRESKIVTTMFTDAYTKEKLYNNLKKNPSNKNIITLDSPEEMEYYYSPNDRNLDALH